jgi:hypothetical protein
MGNFLHRLLNPHCEHCMAEDKAKREEIRLARLEQKEERHDDLVCSSCETLKMQLAIANDEKAQLLSRLLEKPAQPLHQTPPPITRARTPAMLPWPARRQLLENEDRKKAELMQSAPKPDSQLPPETNESSEELERIILEREKVSPDNV